MPVTWEPLGNGYIALSEHHRFGTDAVLLSDFAMPKNGETVCDLCSGCGILPLLWSLSAGVSAKVTALELQPEATDLLRASLARAGLNEQVQVVTGDLRDQAVLPPQSFQKVTCNPPYFAVGSGAVSEIEAVRLARHEGVGCHLADVAEAASRLLLWGGTFALCHRPERLCDVVTELRKAGLEPKRIRFVHNKAEKAPWLLLCEAKKGGKPGISVLPPLVLYSADGAPTEEHRRIYQTIERETQ